MTYKSLMCILRTAEGDMAHLDHAIRLARRYDAHLDVLCLGVDRVQVGFYYAGATALVAENSLAQAEEDARNLKDFASSRLGDSGIRWAAEALVVQWGAIGPAVEQAARYTDLVILPRPYDETRGPEDEAITEAALFLGPTPVLTVPPGWTRDAPAEPVIATNQGPEAMAAVRAALAGLKAVGHANIAIVDPPRHGPERSDPGGALSMMLARHGIRAEVSVLARTMPRISDVLVRHAEDRGADLIIMGAYGHSRLREAVLGGPTRDMLAECPVPVLMAR
ncbi:universal stress protein [Mangrovicoccus algicola]|uniref:Universal stress protein n=1 Tax=Mangrovicoccus algicola TaxID=2771008 RepID=A0A8J6YU03_9RHOB|nr:universal stress protein [Mangrovicoccus algicola]MBE3637522.1 universal stress protein [Mangrovicoccus algicola]